MISKNTISKIFDSVVIEEVIGKFVELKRSGSGFKGNSPWTDESTPSFMVSPSKNIFKCFSSGKGGGIITFLKEKEGYTYPQAIEYLAAQYNITVDYDGNYDKEEFAKRKEELVTCQTMMDKAAEFYKKTFVSAGKTSIAQKHVFGKRKLTQDEVIQWGIGYCPKGDLYRSTLKEAELDLAVELFLIGEKYDIYQNRIIYPIQDISGNVIGLAGRNLEEDSDYAKWINPKNKLPDGIGLYDKDKVWYGLNFAKEAIQNIGKAFIVEGYNDVIAMHKWDCNNTIASCGTNVTENQVILLKRYTDEVVLLYDNDEPGQWQGKKGYMAKVKIYFENKVYQTLEKTKRNESPKTHPDKWKELPKFKNAGREAMLKSINLFLKHGFSVEFCLIPGGLDPDDLTRSKYLKSIEEIGLDNWLEDYTLKGVETKAHWLVSKANSKKEHAQAANEIALMLSLIEDDLLRDLYLTDICKSESLPKTTIKQKITQAIELEKNKKDRFKKGITTELHHAISKLPEGVNADEAHMDGFYAIAEKGNPKTGYWFKPSLEGNYVQMSNFVITPLFHKREGDNTRIIKIQNMFETKVIEVPSKVMNNADMFSNFVYETGAYSFDGAKVHIKKLIRKYLYQYKVAYELTSLGYQPEGFFAFYNAVYTDSLEQYTDEGLIEFKDKHYFSPAVSNIYSDRRGADNEYKNDQYLKYIPTTKRFSDWANLMHEVYEEHAYAGIGFVLGTLYRDLAFQIDGNFPFLYCFGEVQSGKSKFGKSCSSIFFDNKPAFQLNAGTDFAFEQSYGRFINCIQEYNEWDDNVLSDKWFQQVKGAYDGEGRSKGKGGSKGKTVMQEVVSSFLIMGQYMSSKDDGSVPSRSITRQFKQNKDRTEKQTRAYDKIQRWQKEGLTGLLVELLKHNDFIRDNYAIKFSEKLKELTHRLKLKNKNIEERILRSYCMMSSFYDLYTTRIMDLPWTVKNYDTWCFNEIVKWSEVISSRDILVSFWDIMLGLEVKSIIKNNIHFKFEHNVSVFKVTVDGQTVEKKLDRPTSILYVRLNMVHGEYAKEAKMQGETVLNSNSLSTYLKNKPYFLGVINSTRFKGTSTNAMIFDMVKLGVNLDTKETLEDRKNAELEGEKVVDEKELPFQPKTPKKSA